MSIATCREHLEDAHVLRATSWEYESSDPLLSEVLERYRISRPSLTPDSFEQLLVAVNLVAQWKSHPALLSEIFALGPLEQFVAWLFETPYRGKKRAPATVRGRRSSLLTLWDFAHRRDHWNIAAPDSRDLGPIEVVAEDPTAWSPREMQRIIDAAEKEEGFRHWTARHWMLLLDCLWLSGQRISAMLQCRVSDLQENRLCIRAEYTKTGKAAILRLDPAVVAELKGLARGDSSSLIWDFPGCEETMRCRYRGILKRASLEHSRRDLFHKIRRASVTEVVNLTDDDTAGQKHAQHTTVAMTRKSYISQAQRRGKSTSDLLPSLIGPRQKELFD